MSHLRDFDTLFSLAGKTTLVTGSSRGLGLHTATALLRAGCSLVILTARKAHGEDGLDSAVERLNHLPGVNGRAVGVAADVGTSEGVDKLAGKVKGLLEGRGLNVLVCNAGAAWGSRFEDAPPKSSVKILDLNVRGVFELVQR